MKKILKKFGFIHKEDLVDILSENKKDRFRNQINASLRGDKGDFYKGLCFGEFKELNRQVSLVDKYFKF